MKMKRMIMEKKNIFAIIFAMAIVSILILSGPASAFVIGTVDTWNANVDVENGETDIELTLTFTKTDDEIINNASAQLVYYADSDAMLADDETLSPKVYADRCYNSGGTIGIDGETGDAYQGYSHYDNGTLFAGYDYGYGYGYGYGVTGTFKCDFTFENVDPGIYIVGVGFINDILVGGAEAENIFAVGKFSGTTSGNDMTLTSDYTGGLADPENGEMPVTAEIPSGVTITHSDGAPNQILLDVSTMELNRGVDITLSQVFDVSPSGLTLSAPGASLCFAYDSARCPYTEAEVEQYYEDGLITYKKCTGTSESTCTDIEPVIDTTAKTLCVENITSFSTWAVVKLSEESSSDTGSTSSSGVYGGTAASNWIYIQRTDGEKLSLAKSVDYKENDDKTTIEPTLTNDKIDKDTSTFNFEVWVPTACENIMSTEPEYLSLTDEDDGCRAIWYAGSIADSGAKSFEIVTSGQVNGGSVTYKAIYAQAPTEDEDIEELPPMIGDLPGDEEATVGLDLYPKGSVETNEEVTIYITDEEGEPITEEGISVKITYPNGEDVWLTTNSAGGVKFTPKMAGQHWIQVESDTYTSDAMPLNVQTQQDTEDTTPEKEQLIEEPVEDNTGLILGVIAVLIIIAIVGVVLKTKGKKRKGI